jgi:hypothetical protein
MSEANVLPATEARCRVKLEGWAPEVAAAVWADPRPNAMRHGFVELAELLAELVDDHNTVTLVIPDDLAEAVRHREPGVPYTVERGSGLVGGRTMSVDDGTDVILFADPIGMLDEHGTAVLNTDPIPTKIVRRTLVHEAQHVIMKQRGADFSDYEFSSVKGLFGRQMTACAAKLCDEHRAEWHAIRQTESDLPSTGDVADVLQALGQQLAAANQVYQSAPSAPDAVHNLAVAVIQACDPFWTTLGYWLAQYRTGDDHIADIPANIAAMPLWQRYGGESWGFLQKTLVTLPVENLTTSPETLSAAAREVAGSLTASLEQVGFRYEDAGPAFYINRWDFPQQ